jgi:hypothetical protein
MLRARALAALLLLLLPALAVAREPGDPIKLEYVEGDVSAQQIIQDPQGKTIGVILYRQRRRGNVLETRRVAHFEDGSSDEDIAVARVGKTLEAMSGRTIIRDRKGQSVVDIKIDVAGGRVDGFYRDGDERKTVDDREKLEPGTYWGALIFIVAKNYAANAENGKLEFKTVVPTPKPRVLTMELEPAGGGSVKIAGLTRKVEKYTLRPTLGFLIDPILHRFSPTTEFDMEGTDPPGLVRYEGPRNYAGQIIRLE